MGVVDAGGFRAGALGGHLVGLEDVGVVIGEGYAGGEAGDGDVGADGAIERDGGARYAACVYYAVRCSALVAVIAAGKAAGDSLEVARAYGDRRADGCAVGVIRTGDEELGADVAALAGCDFVGLDGGYAAVAVIGAGKVGRAALAAGGGQAGGGGGGDGVDVVVAGGGRARALGGRCVRLDGGRIGRGEGALLTVKELGALLLGEPVAAVVGGDRAGVGADLADGGPPRPPGAVAYGGDVVIGGGFRR